MRFPRALAAALLAALLAVPLGAPVATPARAADLPDLVVLEADPGEFVLEGMDHRWEGDDASFFVNRYAPTADTGWREQITINVTGTGWPDAWWLQLASPPGALLAPGVYRPALGGVSAGDPSQAEVRFHGGGNGCAPGDAGLEIADLARDADDNVVGFALAFFQRCERGRATAHGALRWRSATPLALLAAGDTVPDFESADAGTVGIDREVRLAATGDLPVTLGAIALEGSGTERFEIHDDGCSGATLAPGESCALGLRFAPPTPGHSDVRLVVPSSALAAPRVLQYWGVGTIPTQLTLARAPGWSFPETSVDPIVKVVATLAPATALGGLVHVTLNGELIHTQAAMGGADPLPLYVPYAPGPFVMTVRYLGSPSAMFGGYPLEYGASEATITFDLPETPPIEATGVGLSASSIFPVADGYRDTVTARGTAVATLDVGIRVVPAAGGPAVRAASLGTRTGPYAWAWDGRTAAGVVVAPGAYVVEQTLTDGGGRSETWRTPVTVDSRRLEWRTVTVRRSGAGAAAIVDPGAGWASTGVGTYDRGIRLATGTAPTSWIGARYALAVPGAEVYGAATIRLRARAVAGSGLARAWNPRLGPVTWRGSYDGLVRIAAGDAVRSFAVSASGRVVDRRLNVLVEARPTSRGRSVVDLAWVEVTLRYAVLR